MWTFGAWLVRLFPDLPTTSQHYLLLYPESSCSQSQVKPTTGIICPLPSPGHPDLWPIQIHPLQKDLLWLTHLPVICVFLSQCFSHCVNISFDTVGLGLILFPVHCSIRLHDLILISGSSGWRHLYPSFIFIFLILSKRYLNINQLVHWTNKNKDTRPLTNSTFSNRVTFIFISMF